MKRISNHTYEGSVMLKAMFTALVAIHLYPMVVGTGTYQGNAWVACTDAAGALWDRLATRPW